MMRNRVGMGLAASLCALPLVASAAAPAVDSTPVDGVWVRHDRQFSYIGVTSHYSCDGLEYKLKSLLRLSGARDDLVVHGSCSDPRGGPSQFATARMTYYSLALPGTPQPAAGETGKNLGHPPKDLKVEPPMAGVGHWKTVDLRATHINDIQEGDCELVEQFDREILADFTTRNHDSHFTCIPHQMSLNGIQSHFEVLAPLPKAIVTKKPAATRD
jgi:hypothetical protein